MAGGEVSAGKTQVRAERATGRLRQDVSWVGGVSRGRGCLDLAQGEGGRIELRRGIYAWSPAGLHGIFRSPRVPCPLQVQSRL